MGFCQGQKASPWIASVYSLSWSPVNGFMLKKEWEGQLARWNGKLKSTKEKTVTQVAPTVRSIFPLNSALSLEPPGLCWWHHNLVGLPTWEARSLSPCWTPQSSLQVVTPLWDETPVLQHLSLLCWLGRSKRPCQGAPRFGGQRILDNPWSRGSPLNGGQPLADSRKWKPSCPIVARMWLRPAAWVSVETEPFPVEPLLRASPWTALWL